METCVESLYSLDVGQTEKRRTLDMIRVLKGAISVSKSKTGEVIYRNSKHDKRVLKRQLDLFDKDAQRAKTDTESEKRNILRKWSLVFERQKKICDSLKRFDDMLVSVLDSQRAEEESNKPEDDDGHEKEDKKQERPSQQLASHTQSNTKGVEHTGYSAYQNPTPKLPPATSGFLVQTGNFEMVPEKVKTGIGNDLDNHNPLAEKSFITDFLDEQKYIQEQLLTRNSLSKLKNSLDQEHSFYKLRMKSRLPENPTELLEKVEQGRLLARRASSDPADRSSNKCNGRRNIPGEITRRRSLLMDRSFTHIPNSAERSNSKTFDLQRSKTFHHV